MSSVLEIDQTRQRPFCPVNTMRPHWSFSQLSQFLRCPLQYYFERILKLERLFAPSALVLWAAAFTRHWRSTIGTFRCNQPVPENHVQQTFLNAWQANEDRQPIQFKDKETKDELLAQGVGTAGALHAGAASSEHRCRGAGDDGSALHQQRGMPGKAVDGRAGSPEPGCSWTGGFRVQDQRSSILGSWRPR